mgnify:FL=1
MVKMINKIAFISLLLISFWACKSENEEEYFGIVKNNDSTACVRYM